jgi:hypothetical protein
MTDAPASQKNHMTLRILVSVGLLAIGLLIATVTNAPELFQESIQSALLR